MVSPERGRRTLLLLVAWALEAEVVDVDIVGDDVSADCVVVAALAIKLRSRGIRARVVCVINSLEDIASCLIPL